VVRLLAGCGPVVEDLIEVEVPPGARNEFPAYPDEWIQRWPAEEVWLARRLAVSSSPSGAPSLAGRRPGLLAPRRINLGGFGCWNTTSTPV